MTTINPLNPPAIVQQVEESERQLIDEQLAILEQENHCKWESGRLIHEWTQRYAKGRTDADYSKLIGGKMPRSTCQMRRSVYENYRDVCSTWSKLSYSHYKTSISWDDAEEWLAEADKSDWSVATMQRKRADVYAEFEAEPSPSSANVPKSENQPHSGGSAVDELMNPNGKPKKKTVVVKETPADAVDANPEPPIENPNGGGEELEVAAADPDAQPEPEPQEDPMEVAAKTTYEVLHVVVPKVLGYSLRIDRFLRGVGKDGIDIELIDDCMKQVHAQLVLAERRCRS
jgi:hypothetical protein